MARRRILMIDDEIDLCKMVKRNLELMGDFEVEIATDGPHGLGAAERFKPDLIVLDVLMPDMDGLQVLERLKKNTNTIRIPVIMMSAKRDDVSKMKAAELYDEDYLSKPVSASELIAKISEVLKRRNLGGSGMR